MIRILVGTLLEVGKGIRTPENVTDVLKSGDRAKAGALVPAKGLVLEEVFTPENKNTATFCPTIASM